MQNNENNGRFLEKAPILIHYFGVFWESTKSEVRAPMTQA
jgi:hypothetical protein